MKKPVSVKTAQIVLIAALLAVVFSAPASAKFEVLRPALGAPALVPVGGTFDVELSSKTTAKVSSVHLRYTGDDSVRAGVHPGEIKFTGVTEFRAFVPPGAPMGLYDFCLEYETKYGSHKKCSPNSVNIIEEFKDSFRFAVFSDYHVGDVRALPHNPGISLEELRAKGIAALNAEKPDFVIVPGDLTNWPNTYDTDFRQCVKEFAARMEVPVFVVPGNHDLYSMGKSYIPRIDGKDHWKKSFGPLRMAFDYGPYRFIGFNSYSWPIAYRDRYEEELLKKIGSGSAGIMGEREFNWIRAQVETAGAQGGEPILFAHHDPAHMSKYEGDNKFPVIPRADFTEYLKKAGVKYYFFGHTHDNYEREDGPLTFVSTGTVASGLDPGESWGFRVVDVDAAGNFDMRVVYFWHPQGKKEEKK